MNSEISRMYSAVLKQGMTVQEYYDRTAWFQAVEDLCSKHPIGGHIPPPPHQYSIELKRFISYKAG